jgi:hypothetical protein
VRCLVRGTTHDDLGAIAGNILTNLYKLDLLIVSQGARFTGGSRDDNAISTVGNNMVDVLFNIVPVDFTICGEGSYERDKDLSEGVFCCSHKLSVSLERIRAKHGRAH